MDWQSYEELVKDIYEQLGESSGVEILGWGQSCKVKGELSGIKHQVDVLTSHTDGLHTYRTAIECKCWNKKVSKDAIAKLSQTIEDAKIEKGVVVSISGFTRDAELVAQSKNIDLVVLRQPEDEDWIGHVRQVDISLHSQPPEMYIYDIKVVKDPPTDKSRQKQWRRRASEIVLDMPNGYSGSLGEIIDAVLRSNEAESENSGPSTFTWAKTTSQEDGVYEYSVKFPNGTTFSIPDKDLKVDIKEIQFKVRYSIDTSNIKINAADHVAWILHEIFGDRKFALDTDGTMRQFD